MKEGNLKAKKYTTQSTIDKDISFQKYLELFYKRPDIPYPEDDQMDDDDIFIRKVDGSYIPTENNNEFFSVNAKRNDIERIKAKLKKCRDDDLQRRKLLKNKSDIELPVKKIRSLSIETDQVDISIKEKSVRPPLSASTTYVERFKSTENNNK